MKDPAGEVAGIKRTLRAYALAGLLTPEIKRHLVLELESYGDWSETGLWRYANMLFNPWWKP